MYYDKLQQDLLKYILKHNDKKLKAYHYGMYQDCIAILDDKSVTFIPRDEFYIDIHMILPDEIPFSPNTMATLTQMAAYEVDLLDGDELLSNFMVAKKFKLPNGDIIYINRDLLKPFLDNIEYYEIRSDGPKKPLQIYDRDRLIYICMPIKINKEDINNESEND